MTTDKNATFKQLLADSERETKTITVGDKHKITIRELSGADRFQLAERADDNRWELLKWVCMRGMIDPAPESEDDIENLNPNWVVSIATAITDISGMSAEAQEDSENELADVNDIGGSSRATSIAQSAKRKSA